MNTPEMLEKKLNEYGMYVYYNNDMLNFCNCYVRPENYSDKQFENGTRDFMFLIGVSGSYYGRSASFPDLVLLGCSLL